MRRLRANSKTASCTSRAQLLEKERNEVALAFSCNVQCSRPGAYHVAVTQVGEINTNDFECTAVQLWLSALVRVKPRIDDCAPMVFQREEVPVRDRFGALRKLQL